MSELGVGLIVVLWLGLGGWGFRKLGPETDAKGIGVLFFGSVLLGPFVAGAAFAEYKSSEKPTAQTPK